MFHVVEFEGVRKTVKASPKATVTNLFALAFGGDRWGDLRAKDMLCVGSSKNKDVAERLRSAEGQ